MGKPHNCRVGTTVIRWSDIYPHIFYQRPAHLGGEALRNWWKGMILSECACQLRKLLESISNSRVNWIAMGSSCLAHAFYFSTYSSCCRIRLHLPNRPDAIVLRFFIRPKRSKALIRTFLSKRSFCFILSTLHYEKVGYWTCFSIAV